jgi:nitrogen fixation protein FixH
VSAQTQGGLTGRKVLAIALGAFGVVLAANLTLLFLATGTFSGLVVSNGYIASQSFDRARDAQQALGWQVAVTYKDAALRLDLTDAAGRAVRPVGIAVTVGRPTTEREDRSLELVRTPAGFAAALALDPGAWRVEIAATAEDGTFFSQRRSLLVEAVR